MSHVPVIHEKSTVTYAGSVDWCRGDVLKWNYSGRDWTYLVWDFDAGTCTVTLAAGWRLAYLRYVYLPLRRAWRWIKFYLLGERA